MSIPALNGGATSDGYTDANTVIFTQPRVSFQLQVSNNPVMYQLATPGASGFAQDIVWESLEHQMVQSLSTFDEADAHALGAKLLAGIRVRSQSAGRSAIISVV